ncbi:adenine deaminase [Anaerolentibacter hominis]|uniref:adenine deaminase n=1 Tax=Anaerolentibacter hominis TaxID=3079009 RepID=UPI0031B7ECBB
MKLKPRNQKKLLQAALGTIPSDLVIKNARVVNVFTGEILPGNVFLYDGFISHVEYGNLDDLNAEKVYDANGQFIIPGLIDAHVHIESSMLTPRHFAEAVVPWGTTTVITDPHEIGNVWGIDGVKYMHDSASDVPMRQLIDIPSCVPAVPTIEVAGADFLAEQIRELVKLDRVIGLAEVMDFLAVIYGEDRMMEILKVAEDNGLYIQGHAPFLSGRMLSAYLCGGPNTCHESRRGDEAVEKMRQGMFVDMRESSISKNVTEIWNGVKNFKFFDTLCICTDDRESHEILEKGHINDVLKIAMEHGMDPILAIKSATINTAREIKLEHLGAVAPGYAADLVILPSITEMKPSAVFFEGKLVAENGVLLSPIEPRVFPIEEKNSMHVAVDLSPESFRIKAPVSDGRVKTNVMVFADYTLSSTDAVCEELPVKDGYLDISHDPDLKYVAVINRYGHKRMALHVVRHFGTDHGALASTVSHDSHNLTCVYDTPENAYLAVSELIQAGGGMCAVEDGKVLHTLRLNVGGLISSKPAAELAKDAAQMKEANRRLGLVQMPNPLLRIVTLALPVIPNAKMSDIGLVDVNTKEMIPLFAE